MSEQPGRYQRSPSGMVGAMVILVLFVLGYVGLRALNNNPHDTQVPTVEYASWIRAGVADKKLAMLVPPHLPSGWRATSASYDTGESPHWHLGMLTGTERYVGIEEGRSSADQLVRQYVDKNATRIGPVTIAVPAGWNRPDPTWTAWKDAGGDYAVVAQLGSGATRENVLVVGSAPNQEIRDFAGTMTPGGR